MTTDPRTMLHQVVVLLRDLDPHRYPEALQLAEALLAISAALRPAPRIALRSVDRTVAA